MRRGCDKRALRTINVSEIEQRERRGAREPKKGYKSSSRYKRGGISYSIIYITDRISRVV